MEPKVSIITPTFNRYNYLKSLLNSIKKQSYQNWELLIIDDGSTDNTSKYIRKVKKLNSRIRYYKRTNSYKGAATCRNLGIEKAEGSFLIFLDSDDQLASFALEQRIKFLTKNPTLDFAVFPGLKFLNTPGDSKHIVNNPLKKGESALDAFLNRNTPWQTTAPIWKKKSLVENNILWDNKLKIFQDVDFHIRALTKDLSFEILDTSFVEPDFFWRQNNDDKVSSHQNYPKYFNSCAKFLDNIVEMLKEHDSWTSQTKGYIASYYFFIARVISLQKQPQKAKDIWKMALEHEVTDSCNYQKGRYLLNIFYLLNFLNFQNSYLRKVVRKFYYTLVPDHLDRTSKAQIYTKDIRK